jgi:pimeloyl-ACP methyl ester carboxylesterase
MRGTRHLARVAMPLVRRFPKVASVYLNAEIIDLDAADELVQTVEDPRPTLNREIAEWVRCRDLVVEGRDVGRALTGLDLPVLCVLASADGIVPPEAALSIRSLARPGTVEVLEVGDDETWFAHADLFVSRPARERVFVPIARWLREVSTE